MYKNLILSLILSLFFVLETNSLENNANEKSSVQEIPLLNESTLKLLFVVARHGEIYPNNYMMDANPKYEYAHYRFPPGELSKKGKLTMYNLGNKISLMYPGFLSKLNDTNYETVKVSAVGSTDTLNTRLGALLALKGLRGEDLKETLRTRKWSAQSLSTTRNDEFTDAASDYYLNCPNYWKKQKIALKKEFFPTIKNTKSIPEKLIEVSNINTNDETQSIIDIINKNTAANITENNLVPLLYLYDLYEATYLCDFGMPLWFDENFWLPFHFMVKRYVNASFSTNDLRLLGGGRMVKYFLERLDDTMQGKLEPCDTKLLLHIGYEATISAFFAALGGEGGFTRLKDGNFLKSIRSYEGGHIIIEVHENECSDDYYLRMAYSEAVMLPHHEVIINDCGYPCKLSQLKKKLEKIAVDKDNWMTECNKVKLPKKKSKKITKIKKN